MRTNLFAKNEYWLSHKGPKPGKHQHSMNDEFGISVTLLADIGKQIVRKCDHREDQQERTDDGEIVGFHAPWRVNDPRDWQVDAWQDQLQSMEYDVGMPCMKKDKDSCQQNINRWHMLDFEEWLFSD